MAIVSTELEVQDITTLPKRTASGIDPDTDFVLGVEENGVAYKADIEDLGQSIVQGAKSNLLGRNQTVASALSMLREETNEKIKESYGAPLVANQASDMKDKTRVYVYTGHESGYHHHGWYYWNNVAWTLGDEYNAGIVTTDVTLTLADMPADSKAVGDALEEVNTELSSITDDIEQLQEDSSGYAASTSIAPEYSPSGIYAVGDHCMHNGVLYRCTTAISTAEAWNASHWTADNIKNIADGLKGDVSDLKDDSNKVITRSINLLPKAKKETTVNGVLITYEDGVISMLGTASSGGGRLSRLTDIFTLDAGTYTFWSEPNNIDISSLFLETESNNTIISGVNSGSNGTFTLSVATNVYLGFNLSAGKSYDALWNIQVENGSTKTSYEKPSEISAIDNVARNGVNDVKADIEDIAKLIKGDTDVVKLIKNGNNIVITSMFNNAEMTLTGVITQNDENTFCFDFDSYSGSFIKVASDDISNVYYNGSYRCGGHGNNVVCQVTATSHGLNLANIGKIFTIDGTNWILIKIVNENTLWFVSDPVDTTRPFVTNLPSSGVLTNNTISVTYTAKTIVQLLPNNIKRTYAIFVDGVSIELEDDGTYEGKCITLSETYESLDCIAMVEYLKNNVGNNTNDSYHNDNIGGELQYSVSYQFYGNGTCTIANSIIALRDKIDVNIFGITQAIKYSDNAYVPYTTNLGDITSLPSSNLQITPDAFEDADFPPYKYYQINETTGIGFTIAYDITFGYGIPAVRKNTLSSAGDFNGTTHKMHPNFFGKGAILNVGQIISGAAVRTPIKVVNNGIGYYWHSGKALMIEIEAFAATTISVEIPEKFVGCNATIVKATPTIPLVDFVMTDTKLTIKTSGKGSATIKLI